MNAAEAVRDPAAPRARVRSRWLVHLALISTLALSLVPLLLFGVSPRVVIHVAVACAFILFVILHLTQRKRTVARLTAALTRAGSRPGPAGKLAVSGTVFVFLLANVIASGILDLAGHRNYLLAVPGLPHGISWHGLSGLLFLGYLVAHVIRRRRRLRKSVIR